jgi:hypothetical protein
VIQFLAAYKTQYQSYHPRSLPHSSSTASKNVSFSDHVLIVIIIIIIIIIVERESSVSLATRYGLDG